MIEYDPHKWRGFLGFKGTMLATLSYRAGGIVVIAIGATVGHHHWRPLDISDSGHGLIGAALALLLVFRTNASYDRFWEGRKLWGTMVNTSRNIARLSAVHLHKAPELQRRLLRMTIAFAYASMNELRGEKGLGPMEKEADNARALLAAQHTPTAITVEMTEVLQRAYEEGLISDVQQRSFDQQSNTLVDCIGACERIHKTPLPFAYVVHLRRALIIYCVSLPFALLHKFGWATIPAAFFITIILFGIEEIGVEIEDPFGTDDNDLPLEAICGTIERNVRAYLPEFPLAGESR